MVIKRKTLNAFHATSMSVIKSRTPEQKEKVKPSDFVVGTNENKSPVRSRELRKPQVSSHG